MTEVKAENNTKLISQSDLERIDTLPINPEIVEEIAKQVVLIEKEAIDCQWSHSQAIGKIFEKLREAVRSEISGGQA